MHHENLVQKITVLKAVHTVGFHKMRKAGIKNKKIAKKILQDGKQRLKI